MITINNLHTLTLENLADKSAYDDCEKLKSIASHAAGRNWETIAKGRMGRGEFRIACQSGQYPSIVMEELRRELAELARIDDMMDDATESLAVLELPAGWTAKPGYPVIVLTGPYNAEMPARLRRAGGHWDAVEKTWNIPTEKHASLKRIFANAQKSADQKLAAARAAQESKKLARANDIALKQAERDDAKKRRAVGLQQRVKVVAGRYQIGDELQGKRITGFGQVWTEFGQKIRVTDDTACVYGMMPGLDYYPLVTVPGGTFCYAYFD
jgi:hypothetical protein